MAFVGGKLSKAEGVNGVLPLVEPDISYSPLGQMAFRYPLRRYQEEIVELVNIKLERGERELHIVAPPGAGKTILGLQIISQLKRPSLVLCPNTTIQAQWGQKVDLFMPPELVDFGASELIGTHEDRPLKPITLLTYQVLSTPGREQEYLEMLAHQSWIDELTKGKLLSAGQAELRVLELMQNNKAAYRREMSRHISRLRRKLTEVLDLNEVLHENALELLQALRRQKFALVIFDECHHLTDYWAAVMTHLVKRLDNPIVVGLTGTPPEGKSAGQENRYLSLVGEIDYQVPTPALVKEGGLAPFQDLVFFVEPNAKEGEFLERQHEEFHALLEELAESHEDETASEPVEPRLNESTGGQSKEVVGKTQPSKLTAWIAHRLTKAKEEDWKDFAVRQSDLVLAMGRYLWMKKLPIPREIELNDTLMQAPVADDWMLILEDFALNGLKTSASSDDHKLLAKIKSAMRKLGYGLTETGIRRQASPVDRVLAYSKNKSQAVAKILETEYQDIGDRLRAVVVTDFERMSATSSGTVKGVLDKESGGAISALRELLALPVGTFLSPCLVTGSLLLIDKRICAQFLEAAKAYLKEEGHQFELVVQEEDTDDFVAITAGVSEWQTRLYVGMTTQLFERGITKCLVGTRGIFGEGWDSQALNTLIDLTTTTSAVSVKQLRGRSIRLQTNDPLGSRKVANNWDVVCIAPDLEKGLNDYQRFVRKHEGYFGIADDGQIECGVGHVHPAFCDLSAVEIFTSYGDFNQEMLERAIARDKIYDLWKVGQKYKNRLLGCVEVSRLRKLSLTPPFIRKDMKYKAHAGQLRAALHGVWWEYGALGMVSSALLASILSSANIPLFACCMPFFAFLALAKSKYKLLYQKLKDEIVKPNTQESSLIDIGIAIMTSLQEMKLIPRHVGKECIKVTLRTDGSYRVFLDEVEPEHSEYFARCFREIMAPVSNQPYLIPKYEFTLPRADDKQENERAFFGAYLRGNAAPRIGSYHALPCLFARSEKGRDVFQAAWNKYVSPGFVISTVTKPELLDKYFGLGPSLAKRLIWE